MAYSVNMRPWSYALAARTIRFALLGEVRRPLYVLKLLVCGSVFITKVSILFFLSQSLMSVSARYCVNY